MFESLSPYCKMLDEKASHLVEERKKLLHPIIEYCKYQVDINLNFICTHNSRRSHFAMVWAFMAAHFYQKERVSVFSGGSEVTACNPRTIAALERAGFVIEANGAEENPHYLLRYDDSVEPLEIFSKLITNEHNPSKNFAAVMTCSHADENCPVVIGADARFPLHYVDPKLSDGTEAERQTYDEKSVEIGAEMFYIFKNLAFR